MKKFYTFLSFILILLLSACSNAGNESVISSPIPTKTTVISLSDGDYLIDIEKLTINAAESDFELLDSFFALKKIDFLNTGCYEQILLYRQTHPNIKVSYNIMLPNGTLVPSSTKELNMLDADRETLLEFESFLNYFEELQLIRLGELQEERELELEDVANFLERNPSLDVDLSFTIYDQTINTNDEVINLSHIPVKDKGDAVMTALKCMTDCNYLDMDTCGLTDEDMVVIRDAFPDTKVVWRIWFGDNYSVRTDVEKILASKPSVGGNLLASNTQSLKYCTDVKYLDIGHNMMLQDISFVAHMPKLEVAIVAMADVRDATPLQNCTNLEYLEIQTNYELSDLSPLENLKNLRHLNIAYLFYCDDMTPIYNLTNLERLMIGCITPIPEEQVEEFKRLVPDCLVDTTATDPTSSWWRYIGYNDLTYQAILHPRYELLVEQFGYQRDEYAFCWNDPLY